MVYSALKYERSRIPDIPYVNVGDMVQSLAALQFLPYVSYYTERRTVADPKHHLPSSFCIMNGWYSPGMLPPPPYIIPFYISIHISSREVLTDTVIDHLKLHEPIGCRDASTVFLLREKGIEAYYSGCLTLTFPRQKLKRSDKIYLVDVDTNGLKLIPENIKKSSIVIPYLTPRHILNIVRKTKGKVLRPLPGINNSLREFIELPKVFFSSKYRSLFPQTFTESDLANLIHLFKAQSLLDIYSRAKLVITSRLHVTLPCIALGTPVIFLPRQPHLSGNVRFEIAERYIPLNINVSSSDINWHPEPVNIENLENHQAFLKLLCNEAVERKGNPLKDKPLKHFLEKSLWNVEL